MISEPSAAVLASNAQLVVQEVEAQLVVQEVEEAVPNASAAVFASSSVFPWNRTHINLHLADLEWGNRVQLTSRAPLSFFGIT